MRINLRNDLWAGRDKVRLLGIDPGLTVGIATAVLTRIDLPEPMLPSQGLPGTAWNIEFTTQTLTWPDEVGRLVDEIVGADTLVLEEWRLRSATAKSLSGSTLSGPEVIGFVRGWVRLVGAKMVCGESCYPDVTYQEPSVAALYYDLTMNRMPLDQWPKTEHERDALAHLIGFLYKRSSNG